MVTEAELKNVSFYQDTNDLAWRISREPSASWADLTSRLETPDDKRKLAEEIVGASRQNLERLLMCVLEDIKFV